MDVPAPHQYADSGPPRRPGRIEQKHRPTRGSRIQVGVAIVVPTAILVAVAATLSGGATAATAPQPGQGAQPGTLTMPDPRLKMNPAQAAAAAPVPGVPNPNCSLIVPANPLTAQGLATPFQLTATDPAAGPCNEANVNQSAFVQGAIVTTDGQVTLYDPLVIDQGTQPAAPPAAAQVPPGATVALWFGFNGTNLTLRSAAGTASLTQGRCVNGLRGSIFGQFSYCNAPAFFRVANTQVQRNALQVPGVGTAKDGLPCPTVRDFSLVDQDQSDNVTTHYLANANGQTAQNNAAARAALQQAGQTPIDLANGSDNLLLNAFVLPTLGCTPFTKPDGANDGQAEPSLPLDELSAAANQHAPIALVPLTDPMTLQNNAASATKTNLYRAGVNQPRIGQGDAGNGTTYCSNLFTTPTGIQRVFKDQAIFVNGTSPAPAAASNLFSFLAMRAQMSYTNLNCQALLNQPNPITLTMANNVVTTATFTPNAVTGAAPAAAVPAGTVAVTPTPAASAAPAVTPTPTAGATAAAGPAGTVVPAQAPAPQGRFGRG